ncbi:MAG TPA: glycosyltransferase [Solirubrobacteraceae bacterium]|nr:glycosyltransferase [Solirubrobacteraceae bacterium]
MSETYIIVPCYNERERLDVAAFLDFAHSSSDMRLLFVDDGSTDGTGELLHALASESDGTVVVVRLGSNCGKGAAVRAGFLEAIERGAHVVGYMDADLATPLDEFERLLALREEQQADVVMGSRVALLGHDIRRSLMRHYLGRLFATIASVALGVGAYDTQCGAKIFRVGPGFEQAISKPFRTRWVFDVELLGRLIASEPTARLVEEPLRRWSETSGSKLTFVHMLRASMEVISLARRRSALAEEVQLRPTGLGEIRGEPAQSLASKASATEFMQ